MKRKAALAKAANSTEAATALKMGARIMRVT
jgi:hypothetical protein